MTGLPPITQVARDLGLKVVNGRSAATWRGGKNQRSVTYDDTKGAWYDHGAQEGGGYVALVMKVLRCNRREAFDWLRRQYGLAEPDPTRQRAVRSAAIGLAEWRWRLTQYLRAVRNLIWSECSRIEREATDTADPDWRAVPGRRRIGDGIDSYIDWLQALKGPDLLAVRKRLEAE